jgi:hypothetical protein
MPKVISKKVGNRCGDSEQTRSFAPPFWKLLLATSIDPGRTRDAFRKDRPFRELKEGSGRIFVRTRAPKIYDPTAN